MQRRETRDGGDRPPPLPCPRCGAPLRPSHREYAGGGASVSVMRCSACGYAVSGPARQAADRVPANRGRSRRHQPVDDGPPSNPVIDPELARRLLDGLSEGGSGTSS